MKLSLIGLSLIGLLGGCAHSMMRGTVAMKASENELHVCMGDQEVKAGDHVAFFLNECRGAGGKEGSGRTCKKVRLGEGEVIRPLNEHYSLVRPNPGVKVEEGTVVEKI